MFDTNRGRLAPWTALIVVIALLSPALALAQAVLLQITPRGEFAEIGKDFVLEITVTPAGSEQLLADGIDLQVSIKDGEPFFGTPYPLKALSTAEAGAYTGSAVFEWAAPVGADVLPATETLEVTASVKTSAGVRNGQWSGEIQVDFGEEWSADKISNFIDQKGLAFFLLVVFGFGILMSLSPCIYPMIPITLAVIGAQSQEKGALRGLALSVTYVVGMAMVYAILGALSATVASGITAYMQSPAVVVPIAALLVVLAFGMFGAFELQAPQFLRDKLAGPGGGGGGGGLVGVFAMGLVAGLIASPCVGPFLAALLLWVATTGNWVLGFFSLFTFGIGMGLLLIGVGTFPALLGTMPQSGGWMETIKKGMGLLLLAMALWFVRPGIVLTETVFYPLIGVVTILVSIYVGAFDPLTPDAPWWPRARKGLGIIVLIGGVYLLAGSFLANGFLMPSPLSGAAAGHGPTGASVSPATTAVTGNTATATAPVLPAKVQWEKIHTGDGVQAFIDQRRAEAKAQGKPVMIDFWAEWCVYCKKLDKAVWNVPDVVAESLRFVTIKVDATAPDDEEMAAIKELFQVPGLPRVIFIDSRGEILHGRTCAFKPAPEMLELMQSIR